MRNYGKLTVKPHEVTMPDGANVVLAVMFDDQGVLWRDRALKEPSNWYVVLDDDGSVISAEQDPSHSQIPNHTILGLDDLSGFENRFGNRSIYQAKWDGSKLVLKEVVA